LPAPDGDSEAPGFGKNMRKPLTGSWLAAMQRCSYRSGTEVLFPEVATPPRVRLGRKAREGHHWSERNKPPSLVQGGNYGIASRSDLRGGTLQKPTVKPVDVSANGMSHHQRFPSERSTDDPPPA